MKKFLITAILLSSTSVFADSVYTHYENIRCMTEKNMVEVSNSSDYDETLRSNNKKYLDRCQSRAKSEYEDNKAEIKAEYRKISVNKVVEKKPVAPCMNPYIGMPESQMDRLCIRVERVNTTQGVGYIHKQFVMKNGSYIYTNKGFVDGIQN